MTYSFGGYGLTICNNVIRYNTERIPNPPRFKGNKHNVTIVGGHLYINGWEYDFKNKKWKRTFASLWHLIF